MIDYVCKDNISLMRRLPDKSKDLALADPEYGIKESSKNHKSRNTPVKQKNGSLLVTPQTEYVKSNWDDNVPPPEFFHELFRVTKNQIIFGANYFKEIVGDPFKPVKRKDFDQFIKHNPKGWIIWDKINGASDFSDCEMIWTSFDFDSFVLPFMWNGMLQGKSIKEGRTQQGNKKLNEKRIHLTQKPVAIYLYLLQRFATFNTSVLDTNGGSLSSGIAAIIFGLEDFLGVEKDVDTFNKSVKRKEDFINKLTLF